jgi:hypothetical protein
MKIPLEHMDMLKPPDENESPVNLTINFANAQRK